MTTYAHATPSCDYEIKAFRLCQRRASVEIDRNGSYCAVHARKVLAELARDGIVRATKKLEAAR